MNRNVDVISTELEPTSSRKSFCRKAHVLSDRKGTLYLKSYDTVMCSVGPDNEVRRYSDYRSVTTCAHLRSFFRTCGVNLETKDFYAMPVSDRPRLTINV